MVQIWTILRLSIAILAISNLLVEAGKATKDRRENLEIRASVHKNALKTYGDGFKKQFGNSMNEEVAKQLTDINYIIIDHIMKHESFLAYLQNVFLVLRKYAEGQIKSRYKKLNKIYKKWKKQNFPDQKNKANVLKIQNKQDKENNGLDKKIVKKSKK
ncbi:uncharacterized protein LOC112601839 [Melanaphis sacchari]|uniref:uncharacterized protein LOC112601839 n=1 Tax=Melanaphis sacchari TaxID=742174 RepID=UPI000DC1410B|nr:uncharacterized protein LOC112601839 [Melanaphis sacchari]XP_025205440.1 uncharacterized protein LOC112601839 [Melanaphis sacchari]